MQRSNRERIFSSPLAKGSKPGALPTPELKEEP